MDQPGRPRDPQGATLLLRAWGDGDAAALERLIPLVHGELRQLARRQMRRERAGHTLQPTALVNEAYLRLVDLRQIRWQDRAHFIAMASRVMRRILVDIARSKGYLKRGAGARRVSFDEALVVSPARADDLVAIDAALTRFAAVSPRRARVVELRVFGGLSVEETAATLMVSPETVKRDWKLAKVWLLRELEGATPRDP
jgi:RNA polymerase sigma factor (TIGR02999 family)